MLAWIDFRNLTTFSIAAALAAVAAVLIVRSPRLSRISKACLIVALLVLAAAAGNPHALLPRRGEVVVMVDLSPSTRSALYRDAAALNARIRQLLGDRAFRRIDFGDEASTQTVFDPPTDAGAVLLFSDARFEAPKNAPPTFVVVDGGLIDPDDAAVAAARFGDDQVNLHIAGRGPRRGLAVGDQRLDVSPGTWHRFATPAGLTRATLSPGDRWPENDSLTLAAPVPVEKSRWWISASPAPAGWTATSLPNEADAYLSPAVIALDNQPIDALPPLVQDRLTQYVRDLGGGLLILGGDRAFSAGHYSGSAVDALSPLASDPPTPTRHWLLLTDASGSMAAGNRWASASSAVAAVVRELPPADVVSAGSFAAELRWWIDGKPVREALAAPLPPADLSPAGPTNLHPVLVKLLDSLAGELSKELLLLTDGEAKLENVDALARALRAKRVRLHVLAIGNGPAIAPLKTLATSFTTELDAAKWSAGVQQLLRAARPGGFISVNVAGRTVNANRVWLRDGVEAVLRDGDTPLIAAWRVGNGRVAAMAFGPTDAEREAIARQIGQPPSDPRFKTDWDSPRQVTIDAAEDGKMLNDLRIEVELRSLDGGSTIEAKQTAPGRYVAAWPWSPSPRLAIVKVDEREISRRPLPGRYPPEFDAVGFDTAAAQSLARQTGGGMIEAKQITPIALPRHRLDTALAPWLAALGFVFCGLALVLRNKDYTDFTD